MAYPMHGYHKFVREGFRTRDAHLISWVGKLLGPHARVLVNSRPQPFPRRVLAMWRAEPEPGLIDVGRSVLRLPPMRDRYTWWSSSPPCTGSPLIRPTSRASPGTHSWLRGSSNGMIFVRESW